MKIFVINCTLGYLFNHTNVNLINANKTIPISRRVLNRFKKNPSVSESIEVYNSLEDADVIILFGSTARFLERCKHIEQYSKNNAYLHLYLWNPLRFYVEDPTELSNRWNVWSFSKDDAEALNIGYAETLYNYDLVENAEIETDLFFVGLNKRRSQLLSEIGQIALKNGLRADINVVDNIKRYFSSRYTSRMPYDEVRKRIAHTRVLIDIVQFNQKGLTQRVMESIFFKKKLITNNVSVKNYKFYSPDNVFVIGEDDNSRLKQFVLTPYSNVDGFNLKDFDVHNWLERIINNEDFHE